MNLKHSQAIVLIAIIFISSCTPYKSVPYFQNLKKDTITAVNEKIINYSPLTIQKGDLIAVHVTSASREADAEFNYNLERPSGVNLGGGNGIVVPAENVVYGHLVDPNGNIKLPEIGLFKAEGLTTFEIANSLESKLSKYLTRPDVEVRILNFKISVIGDVAHPGSFDVQNEKITVPQALALAGDLNTTGIRSNILLIREVNGNREEIALNMTSKKIFDSPYYYLKNNDVLYVQPNRDRVAQSDSGVIKISLLISALSVLALFLTRVN